MDVHNLPACQPVLDEARGKRFILSPTAGPFDPDVPEQVIRNYQVLMRTAWEYDWNRQDTPQTGPPGTHLGIVNKHSKQ